MSDENVKTYVFPEGNSQGNNGGIDPNLWLALNNNGGFGGNGNALWIIFLLALFGRNGYGGFFGGGAGYPAGGDSNVINNYLGNGCAKELFMQAISNNGNAISSLATTLNCDINAIQTAINAVQQSIQSVSNQVGLSGQQVINSIQSGNMQLAQQIANCCCENRLAICQQTNTLAQGQNAIANQIAEARASVNTGLERGFSSVAYESQAQTCALQNSLRDVSQANTNAILGELRDWRNSEKDEKIQSLTTELVNIKQNGAFAAMIAPLQADIAAIKAAQPSTTTIQYPQLVGVPASQFYGYGYNYGTNPGFFG